MRRVREIEKDYMPCPDCGIRKVPFQGPVCGACLRKKEREAQAAIEARRARQRTNGLVGDETRAKSVLAAFDDFARSVREAAGLPSRRAAG